MNFHLKEYINNEILPRYDFFDKGHNRDHIIYVIEESLRLSKYYPETNEDIVFATAAYHDTGLAEGREFHHTASHNIVLADNNLRQWFSKEQIQIIAEAVEDHRASSAHEPRTIYGRIVAEADRQIEPITVILRTIQFSLAHYPQMNKEEHWQRTIDHLNEKYAEGGYLKLWIPYSINAEKINELRKMISDNVLLRSVFEKLFNEEFNK